MEYHVVSMDSGATYAPDGTEFNNMQILGCVEAGNVIEARKKFMEENKDMMLKELNQMLIDLVLVRRGDIDGLFDTCKYKERTINIRN